MDRTDEKRDDEFRDTDRDDRDKGTLGIGDADPPRDHVPSRGHGRTLEDSDDTTAGSREVQRTPGATGIDMGAGGTGTEVDRD